MISLSMSELEILASKGAHTLSDKELFDLLLDEDYRVRTVVARVIQLRGNKDMLPRVTSLAYHQESYLREICAFILGQFDTPNKTYRDTYIDILVHLSHDVDEEVRSAVCSAIGHLYFKDMPKVLEEILFTLSNDESSEVRQCVAIALGSVSDVVTSTTILNRLLKDRDNEVVECAETGLEILFDL